MNNLPTEFAKRRQAFFDQLPKNSIALLFNGIELTRNGDITYPFRSQSDFYYLTGIEEPEVVAVFVPQRPEGQYLLFIRPHDPAQARWTGKRLTTDEACAYYGADQAFLIDELTSQLEGLFLGKQNVVYAFTDRRARMKVEDVFRRLPKNSRTNRLLPHQLMNVSPLTRELRLIKDPLEISLLRQAAQISVKAHQHVMQHCKSGLMEYELEAQLRYVFTQQGARFEAYPSIIASGNNACIMHYQKNSDPLQDGDLVLIDAGCEYGYYASDITRTLPVNGKFTVPQRELYQIVLAAQLEGIAAIKPKVTWDTIQNVIAQTITAGLLDLGILKGDLATLIEEKAYQRFYLHHFGHWLGLDTHDPCEYHPDGKSRLFAPGMVLTVEPGLYIPTDYHDVDPRWRGVGIRIEDDVLVTKDGTEVLSQGLAKSMDEIEALME